MTFFLKHTLLLEIPDFFKYQAIVCLLYEDKARTTPLLHCSTHTPSHPDEAELCHLKHPVMVLAKFIVWQISSVESTEAHFHALYSTQPNSKLISWPDIRSTFWYAKDDQRINKWPAVTSSGDCMGQFKRSPEKLCSSHRTCHRWKLSKSLLYFIITHIRVTT